ncbi:MAG: RelA/SpoT family protein [Bacteroidales bacterium]|nr:RelA/SpoT family protein [Bacteroidales bacterium]
MYVVDLKVEKHEILKRYRDVLQALLPSVSVKEKHDIRKAFNLALAAHSNARRKTGEPYVYHPLEVARIVAGEIGLGPVATICALLHDVVEDTEFTLEYIEQQFGPKVASIIDGLTKIDDIPDINIPSLQAENFRKVIVSLSDDVRVILIKLADRLHNMRTLDSMVLEKQIKIASETAFLYAPLALRLGLYAIKSELEDLSLKYTEPEVYKSIARKLHETKAGRQKFINEFVIPIKESLGRHEVIYAMEGREKSISSIWSKMKEKEIPFEEVYDVFAVRIIIDSLPEIEKVDCWRAYSIVTDHYRPQQKRLRDWISTPKANGYESLHTTVMSHTGQWVEVQIRTRRMNEIAERGYAAHWKYKDKNNGSDTGLTPLDRYLMRISDLLQSPDSNALAFLDDFKLNLFSDEIFVFTPKGELRTLPAKSTAMDFAYAIHTEIGNSCIAAKVNHRLVPLNHQLRSGDQVEIITSKKQKPQEIWMTWVVTARARLQIKNAIKEERRKYRTEGKEKLMLYFKNLDVEFSRHNRNSFMEFKSISSPTDLYYYVARGDITMKDVKTCCQDQHKSGWLGFITRSFSKSKSNDIKPLSMLLAEKIKSTPEALLLGDDNSTVRYSYSKCCNPIPGDDIVGFLLPDLTINIHRTNCNEAIQLSSKFGNRIVKTKWKTSEPISVLAGVKISAIDRPGLLFDIVGHISGKHKINIKSFTLDTSGQYSQASVMLYVHDTSGLSKVMEDLRKIKDVKKVTRIERITE